MSTTQIIDKEDAIKHQVKLLRESGIILSDYGGWCRVNFNKIHLLGYRMVYVDNTVHFVTNESFNFMRDPVIYNSNVVRMDWLENLTLAELHARHRSN